MANMTIPEAERNLTPAQVARAGQAAAVGTGVPGDLGAVRVFRGAAVLWTGQDLQYSPGWVHPMFYYNVLAAVMAVVFGIYGTYLRRGRVHEY